MDTKALLQERERLLAVIEEAKSARSIIANIDKLVAQYGANGKSQAAKAREDFWCGKCGQGPYKGMQGLGRHNTTKHTGKAKVLSE